jgi:DNA-binding SARP family transcriptional activator/tetratricopeptide (TPR) repeat protein
MSTVTVVLLDTPTVLLDHQPIKLPYRKAEAAFYYLAVRKKASRTELMTLLWGDFPEETARKNLRNALYKIRKVFGQDVILSPGQSEITVNPEVDWIVDTDLFSSEDHHAWQHYIQGFLHGFHIKDAEDFDVWMERQRQVFLDKYVRKLQTAIRAAWDAGNHDRVIEMAKALTRQDPYDEACRRALMNAFALKGEIHRAVQEYEDITRILSDELGIQPEMETQNLYHSLMHQRRPTEMKDPLQPHEALFGRTDELSQLQQIFDRFRWKPHPRLILISGEAGIGKTMLVQQFLRTEADQHVQVIDANCYQQEEAFLLKPWQPVFSELADLIEREDMQLPLNWIYQISRQFPSFESLIREQKAGPLTEMLPESIHQPLLEAVAGVLKKVAASRPLLILFEDIQWMDPASRQLMQRILQSFSMPVLFVATVRDGYEEHLSALTALAGRKGILHRIPLERFSENDTISWVLQETEDLTLDDLNCHQIYLETGGNPFFVAEYLHALRTFGNTHELSARAQNIMQSRFYEIPEETRKLLELISLFFHRVPLKTLASLSSADEVDVADMLQHLISRGILREVVDGSKVSVMFSHQKFREYVYDQQTMAKRKLLHHRVGLQLESGLKGNAADRLKYTDLAHHYRLSGDYSLALKYTMCYLNAYLDYYHELFPSAMAPQDLTRQSLFLTREEIFQYFGEVEEIMNLMDPEDFQDKDVRFWKTSYLHLKGRLLIREGDYQQGVSTTKEMIELAKQMENWDYAVNGYQQLTNHGIQTQQMEIMRINIEAATQLAETYGLEEKLPVLLRLQGLYLLMKRDFMEAEEVLRKAIDSVRQLKEKHQHHAVHIAACHYYLGEIMRHQGNYQTAISQYQQSIQVCSQQAAHHSIAVFYTGMGQTFLEMGDREEAQAVLEKALHFYRQFEVYWRRSIACACLAQIHAEKGNRSETVRLLKDAERFAEMLQNPYEQSVLQQIHQRINDLLS